MKDLPIKIILKCTKTKCMLFWIFMIIRVYIYMLITQMQTPSAFHNDSVCKCTHTFEMEWFSLSVILVLDFYAFESCKLVLFTAVSTR